MGETANDNRPHADLARLSFDAFNERRKHEWQINYAFWGLTVAVPIYAFKAWVQDSGAIAEYLDATTLVVLALVYGLLFSVYVFLYQVSKQSSAWLDTRWKEYWIDQAAGTPNNVEMPPTGKRHMTKEHWRRAVWAQRWFWGQVLFTLLLTLLSWLIVASLGRMDQLRTGTTLVALACFAMPVVVCSLASGLGYAAAPNEQEKSDA